MVGKTVNFHTPRHATPRLDQVNVIDENWRDRIQMGSAGESRARRESINTHYWHENLI
jgi:hypothetical protein